jgi:hypothetical protein
MSGLNPVASLMKSVFQAKEIMSKTTMFENAKLSAVASCYRCDDRYLKNYMHTAREYIGSPRAIPVSNTSSSSLTKISCVYLNFVQK